MLDDLTAMPQEGAAPSCPEKNNAARSGGGRRILEKGLKSVSDVRPINGTLRSLNPVRRRPYVAGIWRNMQLGSKMSSLQVMIRRWT